MRKTVPFFLIVFLAGAMPLAANSRSVEATFTATLNEIPPGLKELRVWIPLPSSGTHQQVSDVRIDSPYRWERKLEREFGNEYLYAAIPNPPAGELVVSVSFTVKRRAALLARAPIAAASPDQLARNLRADRLVTLSPRVRRLAEEATRGLTNPLLQARAIYDHVLETMIYDKVKPGWGKGDTERACDIRAGNCTDFHSLFISLARAKGIPARFIMGFPIPSKPSGEVKGYHCWAEFYLQDVGWIPVDPSEASKSADPIFRNFLFANLDSGRVEFTKGRDLVLDPRTREPLNYFIYPYAEADGEPVGLPSIELKFHEAPPMESLTTAAH
jgi:transglutaminase-like putative cysteine protease